MRFLRSFGLTLWLSACGGTLDGSGGVDADLERPDAAAAEDARVSVPDSGAFDARAPLPDAGSEPSTGIFLVVGDAAAIATSRDGRTWTDRTLDTGLPGAFFRNAGASAELLLAVGGVNADGIVMRSPDGTTWSRSNVLDEWVGGADVLGSAIVAAGGNGARWISRDGGATFTGTSRFTQGAHYRGVAAGAGVVVAAGHLYDGSEGVLSVSRDGERWEDRRVPGASYNDVVFVAGVFVAVSMRGVVSTSPDGRTWTEHDVGDTDLFAAAHGEDRFFVGGQDLAFESRDLEAWSPAPEGTPSAIARGAGVLVGVFRSGRRYVSDDGRAWDTIRDVPGPSRALVFGGS